MALRKPAPGDFECEAAYAPLFYNDQGGIRLFTPDEVKQAFTASNIPPPDFGGSSLVPIALRWRVSKFLGLPITPFSVWRKQKKSALQSEAAVLNQATGKVQFINGPFFRITLTIKNNTGADLPVTLTTLNALYQANGSKTFQISLAANSSGSLLIDQPNIGGVTISGGASITAASGITMQQYVNDPDWQLIQVVGLPFKTGSIASDLYEPAKQGFINALTDPPAAAIQRINLYSAFTKPSPPSASDGAAIPSFKIPGGVELIESYFKTTAIKNGQMGVLNDIQEMFEKVYKTAPALYSGEQSNYLKEIQSLGVVDPANPHPEDNGTYQIPVCSSTILSASTDCWHALGLGFGTIDFLPRIGTGNPTLFILVRGDLNAFDYMVTATFRTPILVPVFQFPVGIKFKFTGFEETEYAAISHFDIQPPPPPASLAADNVAKNRPLKRDDFYYEQVRLSWIKPAIQDRSPVSYAIAFKNNVINTPVQFLNTDRLFIPGKPQPFMPSKRSDADADDPPGRDGNGFERFFHDRSPAPFAGSVIEKYYAASMNVFGLWSNWIAASDTLTAEAPQIPRIVSAIFTPQFEGVSTHIYTSQLDIVLNYDWEDRTPFEIQLAGYFVSPPVSNPPVVTNGIMLSNAGGIIKKYRIRFTGDTPKLFVLNAANVLEAVPADEGEVISDSAASTGSSNGLPVDTFTDTRTYRVKLKNMQLNFTTQTRLWFALYVNASELINPAAVSAYSKPLSINTADPIPRIPPVFVPDIKWASLPDASNISRYHLSFAPVAGAAGYAVYRAAELSLRDRLNGIAYPKDGTIFQRRDAINGADPADRTNAIDAFIRINTKLLTTPSIELEMDGDTNGLFIYAVSSFTDQQAESSLSDWLYVAVPELIIPAPPVITGVVNKQAVPKAVLKINPGPGNNTGAIEIFRTTKKIISSDVNMMGLPRLKGPVAGWTKFKSVDGIHDLPVINDSDPFDYYKLEDDLAPGWAPYYYRAVGIGINQPINGKIPGRSLSSNLLKLIPPVPEAAPQISNASIINSPISQLRISFRSDAFTAESPYGFHTIFIYKQNDSGLWDEIAGGNIPSLQRLTGGSTEPLNQLVRLAKDPDGFTNYAYNVPVEAKVSFKITVTDPMGRKSESILSFVKPPSGIIISNIIFKRLAGQVSIAFKTNVGKTKPPIGQNTLAISVRKTLIRKTLMTIAMNNIPDKLPLFIPVSAIAGGTVQDAENLFSYIAVFKGSINIKALSSPVELIISIKNPKGVVTSNSINI